MNSSLKKWTKISGITSNKTWGTIRFIPCAQEPTIWSWVIFLIEKRRNFFIFYFFSISFLFLFYFYFSIFIFIFLFLFFYFFYFYFYFFYFFLFSFLFMFWFWIHLISVVSTEMTFYLIKEYLQWEVFRFREFRCRCCTACFFSWWAVIVLFFLISNLPVCSSAFLPPLQFLGRFSATRLTGMRVSLDIYHFFRPPNIVSKHKKISQNPSKSIKPHQSRHKLIESRRKIRQNPSKFIRKSS